MVVEELLELLIDKVDGDLLEAIVLKDLKASNVKHSAEVGFLQIQMVSCKIPTNIDVCQIEWEYAITFIVGSMRVSLHFSISHLKTRSKIALAIPPTALVACSLQRGINVSFC